MRCPKYTGMILLLLTAVTASDSAGHLPEWLGGLRPAYAAAVLSIGIPGASLLDKFTLHTGIPMLNNGNSTVTNVEIKSIALTGGATLTSPPLPFNLGSITTLDADGGMTPLFASFTSPNASLVPGGQYTLTVTGTYQIGTATHKFKATKNLSIPAAAPGSAASLAASAAAHPPEGPFPSEPPSLTEDDANDPAWIEPIGPAVAVTPSTGTAVEDYGVPIAPGGLTSGAIAGIVGGAVTIPINEGLGNGLFKGYPQEPSVSSASHASSDVVFITANSLAVYSTNSGASFTTLDPTTIFANNLDGGFCCDQIVQYAPSIDRFIWLMQFRPKTLTSGAKGQNLLRVAVASPAGIVANAKTAWTYWNLTSNGTFGLGSKKHLDYPDMAVGNNMLYVSCDVVGVGLMVIRIPLSQLQAGGMINLRYTHPANGSTAYGGHLTQTPGNSIFWAGHNNTSSLRVFSWPESSTTYSWSDISIASYSNTGLSSPTPDGFDWMTKLSGFPRTAVLGATRSGNDLWLAWSAGMDHNFPQPHIEMVDLDLANNLNVKQQVQIWNATRAFAYPALATDAATGEIGLSLEHGGTGLFENHAVGFWGDFTVYITTNSTAGVNRYGDYVTIRQNPTLGAFDAVGYEVLTKTSTTSTP
ncbi:MAG TPA: hypothetical protein VMS64_10250, partial [Candidatus Methylomirabilis sp.]|nr:hypothetical protein [Candidatus Methylomirabilis sp.]